MKNKKIWLGLLAIMLVFGMMITGCGDGGGGGTPVKKEDVTKKLRITGVTGISYSHIIAILYNDSDPVAGGFSTTAGGTVTIQLGKAERDKNDKDKVVYNTTEEWKGKGEHYIVLYPSDSKGDSIPNSTRYVTSEKVDFQNETTSVAWSKFGVLKSPSIYYNFSIK